MPITLLTLTCNLVSLKSHPKNSTTVNIFLIITLLIPHRNQLCDTKTPIITHRRSRNTQISTHKVTCSHIPNLIISKQQRILQCLPLIVKKTIYCGKIMSCINGQNNLNTRPSRLKSKSR